MDRKEERENRILVKTDELTPFERFLMDKLLKVEDTCTLCAFIPPENEERECDRWKEGGTDALCYKGLKIHFEAQKRKVNV